MRRALALLFPLLMIAAGPHAPIRSAQPNRVVVVTHGVRITASVPQRSYPRNALVRVWIGLRNVSRHVVYVPGSCRGPTNPNVVVRTGAGQVVFPPLVPVAEPQGPPIMACTPPIPLPLKPRQALHWQQFAMLRGTDIVVRVGLGGPKDYFGPSQWLPVHLRVRLTGSDAPRVTVHTSPSVTVEVSHAPGKGPLIVSEWWLCPNDIPANGARDRMLEPVVGPRLSLPCARPVEWHGVVGRMDHSVARFDWGHASRLTSAADRRTSDRSSTRRA